LFKNARKSLLIISILSFVFTATGLMMLLHIFSIEHHEKHDSKHCSICEQGLVNNKIVVPESCIKTFHVNEISYTIAYRNLSPLKILEYQFPLMRAPPSFC